MYLQCHACHTACFEPVNALLNEDAGLPVLPNIFLSSFACELQAAPCEGAEHEMPLSIA